MRWWSAITGSRAASKVESVDVLIVSTVEPFEQLDDGTVSWRSGRIHSQLIELGITSKIVTSTFNHYTKSFREPSRDGSFILMRSIAYDKNISVRRILNYLLHVPQLLVLVLKYRPSYVLITVPPIAHLCIVPIIKILDSRINFWIDVRDLWPEIFVEFLSRFCGVRFAKACFSHSFFIREFALRKASILTTISPMFAKSISVKDTSILSEFVWFPHPKSVSKARKYRIHRTQDKIRFVYIGSLSRRTGLVNFIRQVGEFVGLSRCEFIIGGKGALEPELKLLKSDGFNIIYRGWVSGNRVEEIFLNADFGMLPYPGTIDFDASFPNKFLEYSALGLRSVSNPLSIYDHPEVPKILRPFHFNAEFRAILNEPLEFDEQEYRKTVFYQTLSDQKMINALGSLAESLKR